jgi:multiple sugar transport system substrate-binding protein
LLGTGAALAYGTFGRAPIVLGQAKPFAGVTLEGHMFDYAPFTEPLKKLIPEFEQKTGAKVNFQTQGFFNYNQRIDLELSTQGRAYDFINVTFIYSGRWIGAKWMTDLEEYLKDPNWTEPDYDVADFGEASMAHFRYPGDGHRHGIPWLTEIMLMSSGRWDIVEKKGRGWPATFAEFMQTCEAIDNTDGVKAWVNENNYNWPWIPFLMGFGGRIFKNPPENLTPTLDTPEVVESANYYARLVRDLAPDGSLSYLNDQALRAQMAGRANFRTQGLGSLIPVVASAESAVRKTARFGPLPVGPKGNFPGIGSHALGIPLGSTKKRAAWEFIKWATSKQMVTRFVTDLEYAGPTRVSVLQNPKFRESTTYNGQVLADMALDVLKKAGAAPYMKYRTVPAFPQVGAVMNKAMQRIVTRQQTAQEAMAQAQREAIADLKKGGFKVDG